MASYTYTLKYLFYQQPKNRHIEFSLELSYGHTVLERAPFTVDPEDEKALELLVRETAIGVEDSEEEERLILSMRWDFPRTQQGFFWMQSRDRTRSSSHIKDERSSMLLLCGSGILYCSVSLLC